MCLHNLQSSCDDESDDGDSSSAANQTANHDQNGSAENDKVTRVIIYSGTSHNGHSDIILPIDFAREIIHF